MGVYEDNTETAFKASKEKYVMCQSFEEACDMLASVVEEGALDFETTALSPTEGRVRITSVCNDDVHFIIDHDFLGPLEKYQAYFERKKWYVYNAKFEVRWLDHNLPFKCEVRDVDHMAKACIGGHPSSLADMAKRDLKLLLDKSEQNSDWSSLALTQMQYDYAAFDSHVTWDLVKFWRNKHATVTALIKEKMGTTLFVPDYLAGAKVFDDAVRSTIEAELTGLQLDSTYHGKLVRLWEKKQQTFERYLRRWTPESVIQNLRSRLQLAKFLQAELPPSLLKGWPRTEKTKEMQLEGDYLRAVSRQLSYPMNRWMAALVGYKYYDKYLSTYGDKLITNQNLKGRISSRFNISQAATGRYSSSNDNLQNIPRKPVVRRSFYSPSKGSDLMCLADYSGIEVRVLAELSGDAGLLHDAIYGDVHITSASAIYKIDRALMVEVLDDKKHKDYYRYKALRSVAKAFTFQLLYGAGYAALALVLRCTYDQAVDAVNAWAEKYPKAYKYRDTMFDFMNATGYLPVCDGRTISVWRDARTMPVAANYPVQGAAASVMYRAMYHVHRRFVEKDIDAVIAATVHDELLCYAHKDCADLAMQEQLDGMRDGWLDIFPGSNTDNLSDFAIGTSWADKP